MAFMENLEKGGEEYEAVKLHLKKALSTDVGAFSEVYSIEAIEKSHNNSLWEKYSTRRNELSARGLPRNERVLLHGTGENAAKNIMHNGFSINKAKKEGMLGPSIYFAEHFRKANHFAHKKSNESNSLNLVVAEVNLSNAREVKTRTEALEYKLDEMTSSAAVTSAFQKYPEMVIRNVNQAYPLYRVKYKRKPVEHSTNSIKPARQTLNPIKHLESPGNFCRSESPIFSDSEISYESAIQLGRHIKIEPTHQSSRARKIQSKRVINHVSPSHRIPVQPSFHSAERAYTIQYKEESRCKELLHILFCGCC